MIRSTLLLLSFILLFSSCTSRAVKQAVKEYTPGQPLFDDTYEWTFYAEFIQKKDSTKEIFFWKEANTAQVHASFKEVNSDTGIWFTDFEGDGKVDILTIYKVLDPTIETIKSEKETILSLKRDEIDELKNIRSSNKTKNFFNKRFKNADKVIKAGLFKMKTSLATRDQDYPNSDN